MEKKLAHLQMIQSVIERFATAQFVIRGWAVTLIAGLFALTSENANANCLVIAYVPTVAFWLLDAYYLAQERSYRGLYNVVREKSEEAIDFEMKSKTTCTAWAWSCFRPVLLLFYGILFASLWLVCHLVGL